MAEPPDLYQHTSVEGPRGPLPAPRACGLISEAGAVGGSSLVLLPGTLHQVPNRRVQTISSEEM